MSFLKKLAERTQQLAAAAAEVTKEKFSDVKVTDEIREERYSICKACPRFVEVTTTCKECGCFMAAKTYLAFAGCPIGKWKPIQIVAAPTDTN